MGRDVAAFATGVIIIAVVTVLVRSPNGASFVTAIGQAVANMLTAASGGSANTGSGSSTGTGGTQTAASSTGNGATTGQGSATASAT